MIIEGKQGGSPTDRDAEIGFVQLREYIDPLARGEAPSAITQLFLEEITMLVRHVALVSLTDQVSPRQLMVAGAAIQKQITRDFAPIWRIDADVAPFGRLSDVPLEYWPVIIGGEMPIGVHGIHLNRQNGQPFALVQFSDNWTLTTSHECLEILADPSGDRIQAGNSYPEDSNSYSLEADTSSEKKSRVPKGRVGYLVEVCDPCAAAQFGYSVNGVLVSDFYTPNFFDPVVVPGVRYSFTGSIKKPRQVLDGGYLSWVEPETKSLRQVFVKEGRETYRRHELPENIANLRRYSDKHSAEHRREAMTGQGPKDPLLLTSIIPNVKGDRNLRSDPPLTNPLDRAHRDNAKMVRELIHNLIHATGKPLPPWLAAPNSGSDDPNEIFF